MYQPALFHLSSFRSMGDSAEQLRVSDLLYGEVTVRISALPVLNYRFRLPLNRRPTFSAV